MEREELLRASAQRHSVRAYDGLALTDADRTYLEARIAAINGETGLHIQLACGEPAAFDSLLAHYGKFSGVVNYLVLAGPDTPGLDEACGYWGELLVLEAQARGESRVTLHVPDYGGGDNWPHAVYLGDRMAASLFKHGLTRELMQIEILPDPALNEQFGLPGGADA